jgi:hypothetical protein
MGRNEMNIIVPAAGLSSRFPGMRPKYLLYDYKHNLMLMSAVKQFYGKYPITVGILREHDEIYQASKFIRHEFGNNINIVVLEKPTLGPADTVYQLLQRSDITGQFLIKDCDSFFEHDITDGNYICTSNIRNHDTLKKLSSKSFVIYNEQEIITNIIEKNVVSDTFCVGAYKFQSADDYKEAFLKIKEYTKEIFVSDVITHLLNNKHIFTKKNVSNYFDVGTAEDWFDYNNKSVIFCDIDGTVLKSQPKFNYDDPKSLENNVKILLSEQKRGCQIIFVTARSYEIEFETRKALNSLGFTNYGLVMGLLNTKRVLINDFNEANPFPRAEAINLKRDSDDLKNFINNR